MARALVGAMAMVALSVGAAQATTGSAPVTVDDAVTMTSPGVAEPNVLANDSDPDGDKLALCRLGASPTGVDAEIINGKLELFAYMPGTYTLTYYACDFEFLTPGTVTVTVKAAPRLHLKVVKSDTRPGRLKIVNTGTIGFHFEWGSYRRNQPDGHVYLAAHERAWIRVRRVSIIWVAHNDHKGSIRVGITRHITLPKGIHALPPGAPPAGTSYSSDTVSHLRWGVTGR